MAQISSCPQTMNKVLFAFFCLVTSLSADHFRLDLEDPLVVRWMQSRVSPHVLITIPGSGTHLVLKAIFLLNESVPRWHFNQELGSVFGFATDPNNPQYLCTHFWMAPNTEALHRALGLKKIICVRDLRDICIAALHKMREQMWPCVNRRHYKVWQTFYELPFDEQLLYAIRYECNPTHPREKIRQFSFQRAFLQAIEYMHDPENIVIRYEDLVGEKGGGSREAQLRELRRLADALELNLTEERLQEVADQLYGEDALDNKKLRKVDPQITFRKGKIGSWKGAFNEEHKQVFKERFGDALVQMGYEESNDW